MPHIKNALIRYRIIDKCLRNKYKPYPTKHELRIACESELFGFTDGANICDSTIEKDMFAMKMEHDAPIKYSRAKGGYYYTDPDFSINDIPLTEEDLSAIKFAANTLMQFKEVDMFKQFGSAIDKIVDRVALSNHENEENQLNSFIQFETAPSSGGSEMLGELFEAIKNNVVIHFNYGTFQTGKVKPRSVLPLFLKEYRNRWYLISFDLEKNKIITYALDRIVGLEISQETHSKPTDFNPKDYFKFSFGISNNGSQPENIVFKAHTIAAKYIISQPLHHTQKVIKEGKNKTTFEIKVIISEELIRNLLSFSSEIEIISPLSLREEIIQRIYKTYDLYN